MATTALARPGVADATRTSAAAATSAKAAEDPQNRFLTLLVTQMKNQDPLNPMDNAEVTSQMAQISTVSGIDKLGDTLRSMQGTLTGAQSVQAVSMIGRHVVAPGDSLQFDGSPVPVGFELEAGAVRAELSIKDAQGRVVHERRLDGLSAGRQSVVWDGSASGGGRAASGLYTFEVKSFDAGGRGVDVKARFGYAAVESVSLGDGVVVNARGLGAVPIAQVEKVV